MHHLEIREFRNPSEQRRQEENSELSRARTVQYRTVNLYRAGTRTRIALCCRDGCCLDDAMIDKSKRKVRKTWAPTTYAPD